MSAGLKTEMNMKLKQSSLAVGCLLSCMVCTAGTVFSDSRYENRLANGVSVIVDERIELVSIAFRLAGAMEYVNDLVPEYMAEIDSCFAPYTDHELLTFIRKARKEYNFAYSIPAKSALMLDLSGGRVRISRNWEIEKEFDSADDLYCWTEDLFREYVDLLDDFYRESGFHEFFLSHKDFYDATVERNTDIPSRVDMSWFEQFYGEPAVGVDLYMGLCNGNSNYSIFDVMHRKDWDGRLAIVIGATDGGGGIPVMLEQHFIAIIHEIAHYYTNPLTDMYYPQMEDSMKAIFPHIKEAMTGIGYGHVETVAGEWINELFTLAYLKASFESGRCLFSYQYNVAHDEESGYIWMGRAMGFMENFLADRTLYPTVKEFMPQIVAFTNELPEKWDTIAAEFENRHPYVTDIYPAGGVIPEGVSIVRIRFSEPMLEGIQGLMRIEGYEMLPFDFKASCWEDERTFVIKLGPLEPGMTYGVGLNKGMFYDSDLVSFAEDYKIVFKAEQ